jgi:selenocysteine lyase/cysteine desulfurase
VFRVPQYKFFGPHQGVLYGRYDLLDQLRAYKVRPAEDVPPDKFETGTKNHEGMAGTTAAVDYLADLGAEFGAPFAEHYPEFEGRRLHLKTAMAAIRALAVTERLGVEDSGGMVRVGIAHYNTANEVDRLLATVNDLARL